MPLRQEQEVAGKQRQNRLSVHTLTPSRAPVFPLLVRSGRAHGTSPGSVPPCNGTDPAPAAVFWSDRWGTCLSRWDKR